MSNKTKKRCIAKGIGLKKKFIELSRNLCSLKNQKINITDDPIVGMIENQLEYAVVKTSEIHS